jgi:hypothetical protein
MKFYERFSSSLGEGDVGPEVRYWASYRMGQLASEGQLGTLRSEHHVCAPWAQIYIVQHAIQFKSELKNHVCHFIFMNPRYKQSSMADFVTDPISNPPDRLTRKMHL